MSWHFVDGAYLDKWVKRVSNSIFGTSEVVFLYRNFLRGERVFYYDCLPGKREREDDASFQTRTETKQAFFDSLRTFPGFHVIEGSVQGTGDRIRQKGVDVQLAVDMLSFAHRKTISEVTLCAGDADFVPLVQAVVREGVWVDLIADRLSLARTLLHAVDRFTYFEPLDLLNCFVWRENSEQAIQYSSGMPSTGSIVLKATVNNKPALIMTNGAMYFLDFYPQRGHLKLLSSDINCLKRLVATTDADINWTPA